MVFSLGSIPFISRLPDVHRARPPSAAARSGAAFARPFTRRIQLGNCSIKHCFCQAVGLFREYRIAHYKPEKLSPGPSPAGSVACLSVLLISRGLLVVSDATSERYLKQSSVFRRTPCFLVGQRGEYGMCPTARNVLAMSCGPAFPAAPGWLPSVGGLTRPEGEPLRPAPAAPVPGRPRGCGGTLAALGLLPRGFSQLRRQLPPTRGRPAGAAADSAAREPTGRGDRFPRGPSSGSAGPQLPRLGIRSRSSTSALWFSFLIAICFIRHLDGTKA